MMEKTKVSVKKKILWAVLAIAVLSLIVFFVHLVKEERLNEARNDFTFSAGWRDNSKTYDSERGVFTYHWKTGVAERKTYEPCGGMHSGVDDATYIAAEDIYLSLSFGDVCSSNPFDDVPPYYETFNLITAYEEKREQDGTAPTPSFEERQEMWIGSESHTIRSYQKGFLMDYYGVVYHLEPDGDSFTVSSFDDIPLIVNFELVGENQDKLLLIENNNEVISLNWHDAHKTIYLYDIPSQRIEKLGTTTTSIDSFAVNKDGTRFAYLNYVDGEYPTLNIYDLKKKKLVTTTSPIKEMGTHTRLNSFKLLTLLDTDEVVATRTDEGLIGSDQTVILLSERGQKKAPKALQEFYIDTGVSGT